MKKKIEGIIFEVLKEEMAIDISNVGISDELAPLADTDDWSFIFIPELEKKARNFCTTKSLVKSRYS